MKIKIIVLILFTTFSSCLPPTKEEKKLISELNNRYKQYHFETFDGVKDVYVKMYLKKPNIDSLELKTVYYEIMKMNHSSNGQLRTNWLYIVVYDEKEKYIFTMRDFGNEFVMMRDKVF